MAKYIIRYALKKGDSENSDLEKKIQEVSASCEKIAKATFVIDSEKTARRIIEDLALVMDIESNLKEEFYTALPAILYDSIGADSMNFQKDKIFIGELRGKAVWCWR